MSASQKEGLFNAFLANLLQTVCSVTVPSFRLVGLEGTLKGPVPGTQGSTKYYLDYL